MVARDSKGGLGWMRLSASHFLKLLSHIQVKEKGNEPLYPNGGCAMSVGVNSGGDRGKQPPFMQSDAMGEHN